MRSASQIGLFAAVFAFGSFGVSGCLGDEATATQVFACPSEAVFTGVSGDGGPAIASVNAFMERRCGTLDCHGIATIPMRLYGRYGRRLDPNDYPGKGPGTTLDELAANYASVCSVEPEKTAEQVQNFGQKAEELLIVRKARGIEGHKGGVVMKEGSPADQCIVGWLRGQKLDAVAPLCQQALDKVD